jgi:hypothetical protein
MSGTCTVIIGAAQHLDTLRRRADSGTEVLAFSDEDALAALAAITKRRPQIITLERLFAATSRGAALINRVKADPSLASAEIRIVSHDGSYSRVSARRGSSPLATVPGETTHAERGDAPAASRHVAPSDSASHLDYHGTRRGRRYRMTEGTEVQLDGVLAKVVDLSAYGAQVISQHQLKPQQRIRVILADDLGMVRLNAAVAWASFEIPKGVTRYRAGIEFKDAEVKSVEAFCMRHKV